MPIPAGLVTEVRQLGRETDIWFSIEEIRGRDRDIDTSAQFIQKSTGKEIHIEHISRKLYSQLETWGRRLLIHEVRLYEFKMWKILADNSFIPTPEDDAILQDCLNQFINDSVGQLEKRIAQFAKCKPEWYAPWSKFGNVGKQLAQEISTTIPLSAEISRIEILDSGHEPLDTIGHAQIRMERFLDNNYLTIPHPFDQERRLNFSPDTLKAAIRLLTYVVYKDLEEERLTGYRNNFISVFLRYLSCSRESSGAVIEQISTLLEPFLKKVSFLFNVSDSEGNPVWHSSLDGLIRALGLCSAELKNTDIAYWRDQETADAIFRVAYQLRHKGAHEAHEYPYFERERHAYYVFAAILVSCDLLLTSTSAIRDVIDFQADVDKIRELFVRIDELNFGPDGPRLGGASGVPPSRLEKLANLSRRAQLVWPNCSVTLCNLLESEYLTVKDELIEADRDADIEAFLESMQPDDEYS